MRSPRDMVTAITIPLDRADFLVFSLRDKSLLSSDRQFALSGSWDSELTSGITTRRFIGHSKDVLSVSFSIDNRQIVSASSSGTLLESTSTRLRAVMPCASAPICIGFVLPQRMV